jgi:hypothetical protein
MSTNDDSGAGASDGSAVGKPESKLAPKKAPGPEGYWPSWRAKVFNDFRSAKAAEPNDGLIAPTFDEPVWAEAAHVGSPTLLEAMRRRHDAADDRIDTAEQRASRLIQFGLSLLALAFVAAGFQASKLRQHHAPLVVWISLMAIAALAILCLAMAVVQAVGIDRVGMAQPADPAEAAPLADEEAQRKYLALQEYRAFEIANWTGKKKGTECLQARAWLTRGLAALALSGVCTIGVWIWAAPRSSPTPPCTATATARHSGRALRVTVICP